MFSEKKSISVRVVGKVQGVWFRDFTKKIAIKYNLTGWVKNDIDGSVVLLAEGDIVDINPFIKCLRSGSQLSKVDDVQIEWQPFENKFNSFKIIR